MAVSKTIIFDLDDTLIKEIDFLKSAFHEIALFVDSKNELLFPQMLEMHFAKKNVFEMIILDYTKIELQELKNIYRNHCPRFDSDLIIKEFLVRIKNLGYKLGLITDGFSITQRNKLKALNIEDLFDIIVISEEFGSTKPDSRNFEVFEHLDSQDFFYLGDNVSKDFITPNKLGWQTICLLNNGQNIHKQNFDLDAVYLPKYLVKNLEEIISIINK